MPPPWHRNASSSPEGTTPEMSNRRLPSLEPVLEATTSSIGRSGPLTVDWTNPYETGAWQNDNTVRTSDGAVTSSASENQVAKRTSSSDNTDSQGEAMPRVSNGAKYSAMTGDLPLRKYISNPQAQFAANFVLFCGITFAIPIYCVYRMAQDPHVQFWICSHLHVVILLLPLYFLTYAVHLAKANPSKVAIAACLIGSPLLLLCVSDYVLLRAYQLGNIFSAHDCDTWDGKRRLENEWQSANAFYTSCMTATVQQTGSDFRTVSSRYRIRDCGGYGQQLKQHPEWAYFGLLEDTLQCAGWCDRAQPLFTFAKTKDSCSSAVAHMMYNRVQWTMMQAAVYSLVVLCLAAVALVVAGPALSGLDALLPA